MTRKQPAFDTGRSVGEREGTPLYGAPDEAYRVSGGVDQYMGAGRLLPPGDGTRREPIRGSAIFESVADTQGARIASGESVIMGPSHREVQGLVAERMAATLSMPQAANSVIRRQRGMPGIADAPDGTPRIRAVHRFDYGLGPAVAQPATLGPASQPDVLDKYVGARQLLPPRSAGRDSELDAIRTQFDVMGQDIARISNSQGRQQ